MIVDYMEAVTVDEVHGFLYWSDTADRRVRRVRLDGTNQVNVYSSSKLSYVRYQMVWCVIIKHPVRCYEILLGLKVVRIVVESGVRVDRLW